MDYSLVNDTFVSFTTENSSILIKNSTKASTEKDSHHFPTDMLSFTAACAFIIAIFGTMGNLLSIFALPMSKKLRTTATAFVINLAVVELLFCVCILPMSGAQYAYLSYEAKPLFSDRDCIFFALARYTFTQVELQTILAIAFTRAIAVGFPRFYQKIDNRVVTGIYIFFIWVYSFFLKLPTALGKFGSYVFNRVTMECDMSDDISSKYARIILIVIEALVPVSIILILYVFIFIMVIRRGMIRSRKFHKPPSISSSSYYVKKSSMRVARGTHKSPKPSLTSTASSSFSEDSSKDASGRKASIASYKSLKRMVSDTNLKARFTRRSSSTCLPPTSRRDMRVARMIFIIFMMVLICSVPVGMIHAADRTVEMPRRFLAVHILYWLQYSLNVFVYVLMNRQYREAYIDFVARMLPSWERHKTFIFPWENPSISSRPPQGLNSSFKSKKDSTSQDPSAAPKEYKPVEAIPHNTRGRLSAILEVNSSSCVSSDDVFVGPAEIKDKDEKYGNKRAETNSNEEEEEQSSQIKNFPEEGTDEEKQKWLSQNEENICDQNKEKNV